MCLCVYFNLVSRFVLILKHYGWRIESIKLVGDQCPSGGKRLRMAWLRLTVRETYCLFPLRNNVFCYSLRRTESFSLNLAVWKRCLWIELVPLSGSWRWRKSNEHWHENCATTLPNVLFLISQYFDVYAMRLYLSLVCSLLQKFIIFFLDGGWGCFLNVWFCWFQDLWQKRKFFWRGFISFCLAT